MGHIKDSAIHLYGRAKSGWEPTSREIGEYYNVEDQQVSGIKSRVKSLAADDGIVWGYHPVHARYMLAPSHECAQQREIIEYALRNASKSVNAVRDQLRGAVVGGSVSNPSAELAQRSLRRAARTIADSGGKLEWAA